MIEQRSISLRGARRFCMHTLLSSVLFFTCTVIASPVFAVTDTPVGAPGFSQAQQLATGVDGIRPPRGIPPQEAIEACNGKKEGDPCTINTFRGNLNGLCFTGDENVFACRPKRRAAPAVAPASSTEQPAKAVRKNAPEHRPLHQVTVPPEIRTSPKEISGSGPQEIPSQHRQITNPVSMPTKQLPASQTKSATPQSKPSPPSQTKSATPQSEPSPPLATFFEMLGRYAGNWGSYLAVALLSSGLTWFWFFRYFTIPLRRLSKVTQKLAEGDLSARVGEGLVHRKDEVADLGRDVDRMAERIESLVGAHQRLIRDVSHELRSPLARLNVALELARQSAGPAHTAPFDRIERESDRLNELIGQLLMLTKLESESGSIKRSELDITALIVEIAKDADFEAKNNHRQVIVTVSEKIMLNGNSELLRQAIENLVRNAVRYTEQGTSVEI